MVVTMLKEMEMTTSTSLQPNKRHNHSLLAIKHKSLEPIYSIRASPTIPENYFLNYTFSILFLIVTIDFFVTFDRSSYSKYLFKYVIS
jgi:hypothetical protein